MPSTAEAAGIGGFILHERARSYHWEGEGRLSIKSFFNGRAIYDAGLGCHAVDDRSYLVLNNGTRYAITIESERPVESFCVFFDRGFGEEVERSLRGRPEQLLDEPFLHAEMEIELFECTNPHNDVISPVLLALRDALPTRGNDPLWITERMHLLMERLLEHHRGLVKKADALPAMRASTRRELYRRLLRARDYATALYERPLTLNDMAGAACLSPNHFIRAFKSAFGMTPHQFLMSVRLKRACDLLESTDLPVGEIGMRVGFESFGSFSWLFKRRFGCSPERYRLRKK